MYSTWSASLGIGSPRVNVKEPSGAPVVASSRAMPFSCAIPFLICVRKLPPTYSAVPLSARACTVPDSGAAKPGTTWPSVGWPGVTENWTRPGSLTPFTVVKLPPT